MQVTSVSMVQLCSSAMAGLVMQWSREEKGSSPAGPCSAESQRSSLQGSGSLQVVQNTRQTHDAWQVHEVAAFLLHEKGPCIKKWNPTHTHTHPPRKAGTALAHVIVRT